MASNNLRQFFSPVAARLPMLGLLFGTWALLAPAIAHATCTLISSTTGADLGRSIAQALPIAADNKSYRLMGVRNITLNGSCDTSQPSIRLAFTGLRQIVGKPLVQWGGGPGAVAFQIESVTVGGARVPLAVLGEGSLAALSVNLVQDSTVELDLTRLPVDGRKTFAVQLRLTGLVPESFAPRVQTKFDSHFSVRMLGAQ